MRPRLFAVALVLLAASTAALAAEPAPYVRACDSSQYGDLGRGWRSRAVVAGDVAFVGLRDGYSRDAIDRLPSGRANLLKVLVVVDPAKTVTVRVAARSRGLAALGYNGVRHEGRGVPLDQGTARVRFHACRAEPSREPWNRGTQFGGYFLVLRPGCVRVEVWTDGRLVRRPLRFGVPRCGA